MKNKCIIFDLDGTLLNTLPDITSSLNRALAAFGFRQVTEEQTETFVGNGAKNLVKRAIGKDVGEETLDAVYKRYGEEYSENLIVKTKMYDGIAEELKILQNDGFSLAIVSNKPDSQTKRIAEAFFPDVHFDVVFGKRDGVPLKPDPYSALEAMKIIGSDKENTVFVGDSPEDFKTAQNAGIKCISVLWGYRKKEAYSDFGNVVFIEKPAQLHAAVMNRIGNR